MFLGKFRDDYETNSYRDVSGLHRTVTYVGDVYELPYDKVKKSKVGFVNLGFGLFFAAMFILMGMINQPSGRTSWIVMPYMCLFIPVVYYFMGAIRFMRGPLRMQRADYKLSVLRMKVSAKGMMIILIFCAVLDLIFIFFNMGVAHIGREVVYLAFHLIFIGGIIAYGKLYDRFYGGIKIDPGKKSR